MSELSSERLWQALSASSKEGYEQAKKQAVKILSDYEYNQGGDCEYDMGKKHASEYLLEVVSDMTPEPKESAPE